MIEILNYAMMAWIVIGSGAFLISQLRVIRRKKARLIELKYNISQYQDQFQRSGYEGEDELKAMMQIQNEIWIMNRFLRGWRFLVKLEGSK